MSETRQLLRDWVLSAAEELDLATQDVLRLRRILAGQKRKQANTKWAAGAGAAGGIALLAIDITTGGLISLTLAIGAGVHVFKGQEGDIAETEQDLDQGSIEKADLRAEIANVRALAAKETQGALGPSTPAHLLPDGDESL